MMSSLKLPPDPSAATSYELWKKDAKVWQELTDVALEKQGFALQYACRGDPQVHEAVMAVKKTKVKGKKGFNNIMSVGYIIQGG